MLDSADEVPPETEKSLPWKQGDSGEGGGRGRGEGGGWGQEVEAVGRV